MIIIFCRNRFSLKSQTFLLIFLTMLVPASMFLVPIQAQEDQSLEVSSSLGTQGVPLKAIKDSDGIEPVDDFEIEPQNVITVLHGQPFHVLHDDGSLIAVKATDQQRITTELQFSQSDGRVTQNLASGSYLLDVIIEMDNDDRFLYETILTVLTPGQTLSQVTIQNIIQNFVSSSSTSSSHTTVVFEDDNDNDNSEPDREEICRFTPSHPICAPDENGECGEDFNMNEDGQCFPDSDCPDGYHRANDDETGACISEEDLEQCPDGSWQHPGDTCFGELPPFPEPEPECEPNFILENGVCTEMTSNCGGEPCTPSQKEDSTVSDVIPGEPHTPTTESEETESGTEEQQNDDEQTEEQDPEQEESSAEDSEQES